MNRTGFVVAAHPLLATPTRHRWSGLSRLLPLLLLALWLPLLRLLPSFLIQLRQCLARLLNPLLALLLQDLLLHLLPDALCASLFSEPNDQNAGTQSKSEGVDQPPASGHLRPPDQVISICFDLRNVAINCKGCCAKQDAE
jgi:hypothetical protein